MTPIVDGAQAEVEGVRDDAARGPRVGTGLAPP